MKLKCNCCDGIYNSIDVHFTSACDNKCAHCVDLNYKGLGISKPDVKAIVSTIIANSANLDDILFLGGEPCLYLEELIECVEKLREKTGLKLFVTTSVPKTCYDNRDRFEYLISILDGMNLSVQHNSPIIADTIRRTESKFNRNEFYKSLPYKGKIRINLNLVKPYLHIREQIEQCLKFYDKMGFNSIKLSEIQHGEEYYVSFAKVFDISMNSAYAHGCQTYLDMESILPGFKTPVLLKRSCFLCEDTLKASFADGVKMLSRIFMRPRNNYGVVYEDGTLTKGWI